MAKVYTESKIIEYTGTLPITIKANGSTLIDYRIYGSAGGVGDRTVNLFDVKEISANKYISYIQNGALINTPNSNTSAFIDVNSGDTYKITWKKNSELYSTSDRELLFFNANKKYINSFAVIPVAEGQTNFTFTAPSNAAYARFDYDKSFVDVMLTEGSTAPTEYVPYGYEVDMSVSSANLFDKSNCDPRTNVYLNSDGLVSTLPQVIKQWTISDYIPITPDVSIYLASGLSVGGKETYCCVYDSNKIFRRSYLIVANQNVSITTQPGDAYVRLSVRLINNEINTAMLTKGSTAPSTYIPYSSTTTTIYIGDEPLGEDEYVNYGSGKIYRMVGGVPAPTDPPVPFPALPTVAGVNIVDYAGQSAAPSQMYIKYNSFSGWGSCVEYVRRNGAWVPCTEYIRRNGVWVPQT